MAHAQAQRDARLSQEQPRPRRRLTLDLAALELAFQNGSGEASHCLNIETGQVLLVTNEVLENPRVQEHLADAIGGRGAFRRFKDVLVRYPGERDRWLAFKAARLRERVLAWLAEEEPEPVSDRTL